MNIDVSVKYTIPKPLVEVFDAVFNTDKLICFFISRTSGALIEGKTIMWHFDDYNVQVPVDVKKIKTNELISFEWTDNGKKSKVDIAFSAVDDNSSTILITEKSFPLDEAGAKKAMNQTQGWTDFACCLKAYLYSGVNLRNGKMIKT